MNRLIITALAATLILPGAAMAKQPNGVTHGPVVQAKAGGCPPGLAKKSPACVPPGLAKKQHQGGDRVRHDDRDIHIRVGDRIDPHYVGTRYIVVNDPTRYGLDPRYSYYRYDNNVYRVDQETREVLALIGAVSAILN